LNPRNNGRELPSQARGCCGRPFGESHAQGRRTGLVGSLKIDFTLNITQDLVGLGHEAQSVGFPHLGSVTVHCKHHGMGAPDAGPLSCTGPLAEEPFDTT
jgi:hypothetical protein